MSLVTHVRRHFQGTQFGGQFAPAASLRRLEASRGNGCLHTLHPHPRVASPWHVAWPLLGVKEAA